MAKLQERVSAIILKDPAVYSVFMDIGGGNGGNAMNQGHVNITLKPLSERNVSSKEVIDRLSQALNAQQGIKLFMHSAQDINIGARPAKTQYQFTLQDADITELDNWAAKITERLQGLPDLRDVGSDQQAEAPRLAITIDRAAATLYGVMPANIDQTLYDAFGQRQVASYSTQSDTYHVILEVLPNLQRDIATLDRLSVRANNGTLVPLSVSPNGRPTASRRSRSRIRASRGGHCVFQSGAQCCARRCDQGGGKRGLQMHRQHPCKPAFPAAPRRSRIRSRPCRF